MNHQHTNIFLVILLILIVSTTSCTKDIGPIEPVIEINTISYTTDIQPIFNANCTTSCHDTEHSEYNGNLNLTPDNSYTNLVGVVTQAYNPNIRVVSADAEASVLWHKINDSGTYGAAMPLGASGLSVNDIEKIRVWIMEGALDN